jgi:hypothetical protein
MIRRRFDNKENYMIGEDLEGYWRASQDVQNMFRDILTTYQTN